VTTEQDTGPISDTAAASDLALAGVRVLDLSEGIAGPYATKWLAGMGADVIKVEPPTGDASRGFGPWPNDDPDDETSGHYLYLNTNKRGITLNVETSDGREILRELAAKAEIIVESYTPGFLDQLGLGYDVLRADHADLVLVSITPYGQTGPYADLPWTEMTVYAMSGHMGLTGDPHRAPLKNGGSQVSYQAGLNAVTATLMAYYGALVRGEGTHVDLSMEESFASMLELYGPQANQRGIEGDRRGNFLNAFFGIYPCADGHAGLCILPRNYDRMAAAVGIPELEGVAYADPSARLENEDFLQALMYGWFADKTRKAIFELGIASQFPTGYVATIEDLMESEHLNGRGFFVEEDHPQAGALKYPGRLWDSDEQRWLSGRAPRLGEHNVEVLHDELGYDDEDLARLRELNAI